LADTLAIIPAFNEEERIGRVVRELQALALGADVLVVNDGSGDRTAAEARRAGATVVSHPFNLGYGATLQTAYKYALRGGYRFALQLDADGQHPPGESPKVLEPVRRGEADVVIGSRFMAGSAGYRVPLARRIGIRLFGRLAGRLAGERMTDVTSGFIAVNRPVIALFAGEIFPADFPDADVRMILHKAGFRVRETPVTMQAGPPHKSMHGGLQTMWYIAKMLISMLIVAISRRPARPDAEEKP
jgi:glycosyltransferase involved in cell wall biosynthesis